MSLLRMVSAPTAGLCERCPRGRSFLLLQTVPSGVRFKGTHVCEKLGMTRGDSRWLLLSWPGVFLSCPLWEDLLLFSSRFPADAPAPSALVERTGSERGVDSATCRPHGPGLAPLQGVQRPPHPVCAPHSGGRPTVASFSRLFLASGYL